MGSNPNITKDVTTRDWIQEDSHHSNPDSSTNITNLQIDTHTDNVLISNHFFYFGSAAPLVDLESINYGVESGILSSNLWTNKVCPCTPNQKNCNGNI